MEIQISLINSYLAFCFLLFSVTTLLQLGVYYIYIVYKNEVIKIDHQLKSAQWVYQSIE